MNANIAVIFGVLLKVYDDMEDNPIIAQYCTPQIMEIIKALIIASLTYVSIYNMNVPIVMFIGNFIHYIMTDDLALSTDFYRANMIISLLLSLITYDVSAWSIILIITILYCIFSGYIDHILLPEEHSWKKIIGRAVFSIGLIISLPFSVYVIDRDIILFTIGYCMTSVLLMLYAQLNEMPKEPKETKEASEKEIRLPMESST